MNERYSTSYRQEFPITKKYLYLDHAGVSPVPLRVKAAVQSFFAESSKNGAFFYPQWSQRITEVRKACAALVNGEEQEIAFVKNTSHGLSIVAEGLDWKQGDNLIVYEREFPANLYPWRHAQRKGADVRIIPFRDGRIHLQDLMDRMGAGTRLVSLSSVQFTNGYRADLKKIGELCRSRGVLFCVDAIQSLGIIPMDVKNYCIDFLSADAHKWLLGPEGIGLFFCRAALAERLTPPLIGWKSVRTEFDFERPFFSLKPDALRFEEGSLNLMGIFGLGAALDLLFEVGIENIEERVLELGDEIFKEAEIRNYRMLTPKNRMERGGSITFSGNFDPERMKDALLEAGVMVNVRGGGIRVSPHFYNTKIEIRQLFRTMDRLARKKHLAP